MEIIKVGKKYADPIMITESNRYAYKIEIWNLIYALNREFHNQYNENLYSEYIFKNGLNLFVGSTRNLLDGNITDKEFVMHKPIVGDIDILIQDNQFEKLISLLKRLGYIDRNQIVGMKRHADSLSLDLLMHCGLTMHVDLNKAKFENGKPSPIYKIALNSAWRDTKQGIKGKHHKILINVLAKRKDMTFSTKGLRRANWEDGYGLFQPRQISKILFGKKTNPKKVYSFVGLVSEIQKHIPREEYPAICEAFKKNLTEPEDQKAIEYIERKLNILKGIWDDVLSCNSCS